MNIRTAYQSVDFMDMPEPWTAIDADTYDGEGSPVGYGTTAEEATTDLMRQIEDLGD